MHDSNRQVNTVVEAPNRFVLFFLFLTFSFIFFLSSSIFFLSFIFFLSLSFIFSINFLRRCLAVAVDGFGRVSLVDTRACVIVRMWKGYRDAQCGWMVVRERAEEHKKAEERGGRGEERRVLLYLVIHAPKRGLVEVWRMRHGARVCAHAIGAGWRLVTTSDTCYFMDKNGLIHQLVLKE